MSSHPLRLLTCGAAGLCLLMGTAAAQAPAPVAPGQAPTEPTAPMPPPNYTYTVDGRRDPFMALITRQGQQRGTVEAPARGDGLAGVTVDELVVRGIIQSQGRWVAMVTGPTGKVFTARPGDRLADGVIQAVTPQALILRQQVNDPLSVEKQREVRKFLRGGENK